MDLEATMTATDSAVATEPSTVVGDNGAGGTGTEVTNVGDNGATQVTEATQQLDATSTDGTQTVELDLFEPGRPAPLPNEIRSLMADKDLAANPLVAAALKNLQSTYDRLNAYSSHFATVGDAKKFTEAFPGGLQDALTAQARAQELDNSDAAFYSRDPKQTYDLSMSWAKNDPEAYAVLTRSGVEALAATNPDAYRQLGLDIVEQTLAGMQQAAFQRNDQEAAARIAQTHQDIFGRKPGEQPRTDPRDTKHQQREQQQTQRETQFLNQVTANFMKTSNDQAGERFAKTVQSAVNQVLRESKVSDKQKARLSNDLYEEINGKLKQDAGLQNQISAIVNAAKRTGNFTLQDQQKYINAIYAKAQSLLRSTGPQFIGEWTETFLGVKRADLAKRETAASRTDVTGGGSPNLGMPALTGDKILNMTDEELRSYKGPIDPNWRKQMNDARFASSRK